MTKKCGTSKVLCRYETNQRAPKISIAAAYAEKLNVSLDYMLDDNDEEQVFQDLSPKTKRKPFYKIFINVTEQMGLDFPGIVRVTGLTDSQVRSIISSILKTHRSRSHCFSAIN